MREVAVVFDKDANPLFWTVGSGGAIEDSRSLWDVLWDNRENVMGVAHTHPWPGPTGPSGTDVTTFTAIESGLGKKLLWPIVTMTHEHFFIHNFFAGRWSEADVELPEMKKFRNGSNWKSLVEELRRRSQGEANG